MHRVYIPFDEQHLDMGSSFSNLYTETEEWLYQYCNEDWFFEYDGEYYVDFKQEHHATLFTLRWI